MTAAKTTLHPLHPHAELAGHDQPSECPALLVASMSRLLANYCASRSHNQACRLYAQDYRICGVARYCRITNRCYRNRSVQPYAFDWPVGDPRLVAGNRPGVPVTAACDIDADSAVGAAIGFTDCAIVVEELTGID